MLLRNFAISCSKVFVLSLLYFQVSLSMTGIMAADSVSHTLQVQQWDGEVRQESKHAADLKQLDNGVKIPPRLCICLYIIVLSFHHCSVCPDVYSYDEDDMVLDSKLPEHLAHFGIDMMTMEKTERTMTELEIAVNQRVGEWEVIQESGTTLKPLFGTGLTGMKNLGNSCYLNSVMQVLFTIPDFQSTSSFLPIDNRMLRSFYCTSLTWWRFLVEEKIVCQQSQKAKYTQRVDYIVQLPVPMDQATNTGKVLIGRHVSIDVPDTLDLSALRATGQQPGEELLPEVAPPPLMTPDVEVKGILGSHGIEDDDSLYSPLLYFSAPLVLPGSSSGPGTTPTESLSEEHLATIVSMGFSRDQATKALRATSNVLDRAVDWIFSHLDDLESMDVSEGGRSAAESEGGRDPPPGPRVRDGPGSELMRE
ncbi:hypothetical protein XENOCAPTIV_024218 [Xenoophorus captivus]|uniref:UBA domain-containing protein n=1 Tax=Xenoophorus captivus TaxID=1517983 RepID=A0ABV0RB68_9TELE